MKTIRQWLKALPAEITDLALKNTPNWVSESEQKCLGNALLGAFCWNKTPEGYDFWFNVYSGTDHFKDRLIEERRKFDEE